MSQTQRRPFVPVVLLAAVAVMLWIPTTCLAADPAGEWVGKVKGPNDKDVEIKLTLDNSQNTWKAALTDTTLGQVTLSDVRVSGRSVSFKFQPAGVPYPATFAGFYDAEHDRLSGTFAVRGTSRFVKFKRISGGGMRVEAPAEPKIPSRIRHEFKLGVSGRLSQWASLHVVKAETYNINAATKSALNYDGSLRFFLQDGLCLFGRVYRGGQKFSDDPDVIGQWPELGVSSDAYLKLDGWEIGLSGFLGNKIMKKSDFNPYMTGTLGKASWELNKSGRGSDVVVFDRQPLEGKDWAFSGGLGTEYEINQRFQLEFEIVWRYFLTEDSLLWSDVENTWSNTHAFAVSFGATYGLF